MIKTFHITIVTEYLSLLIYNMNILHESLYCQVYNESNCNSKFMNQSQCVYPEVL